MNLGIQNKKLIGDQIAFFRFNDPIKNQMVFEVRLSGNNEIVYDIWLNPLFLPIETASNLSNMIEIYGEPSVVLYYLYPYSTPQIKIAPIFIFEDYNFYLAYNSTEALQEGENLKACFEEEPFIYSWNPKFSPFSDSYYRITSMEKSDKQLYFDDIKIVQSSKNNGDECILMDYDLVIKGGR